MKVMGKEKPWGGNSRPFLELNGEFDKPSVTGRLHGHEITQTLGSQEGRGRTASC